MPSLTQRLLLIVCLAWVATPPTSGAACLPRGTTCDEIAKADLVFIAEVLEATFVPRTDEQGRPYPEGIVNYRFNVLEGLKGTEGGEFEAQFYFGGGRDLDQFKPGGRYIVFANRTTAGIYRSGCSLTREITAVGQREWFPSMKSELDLCLKR